jgi:hypothetical protein
MKILVFALLTWVFTVTAAVAGPGHDHGEVPAAAWPSVYVPKLVAESETTELVAVVQDATLRIYLDAWADNRPLDAELSLELNGESFPVKQLEPGLFEVDMTSLREQSMVSLLATVNVNGEIDLLAGDLVLRQDEPHDHAFYWDDYRTPILAILGLLILVLLALWITRERSPNRLQS